MKLRLLPVIMTVIVSGGLLFGGWFAYQSFAVESPVVDMVRGMDGVKDAQVESTRRTLQVRLKLDEQADLSVIYRSIIERSKSDIGSRALDIVIENESSELLNRIWSTVLFDIAEAMDTRSYGDIPKRMEELEHTHAGLQVITAMDDHYVYITMKLEDKIKYVILPRTPNSLGVWPNE